MREVADAIGYPVEALEFVQRGLTFAVSKFHGPDAPPGPGRHVSGQQLCEGLREYALEQWGMLARTVLSRWNIRATMDFGRIVYGLVDHGYLKTTDEDRIDDFKGVYDFKTAFEAGYRIASKT